MDNIKVKKSKNFDRNLDFSKMDKPIQNNLFAIANIVNTSAKQSFIPIATRATYNSAKVKKDKKYTYVLESLNWANTAGSGIDRYHYSKPNKQYTIVNNGKRLVVPADKNAGKFEWYDKALEKEADKIDDAKSKGVIA